MQDQKLIKILSSLTGIDPGRVHQVVELLETGSTVHFIARYRKEKTGGLDEIQIRLIQEKLQYLKELEERKLTIINTIREQGKLTPELEESVNNCLERNKLEDLYLPFRPKRKTKASIAKEKGLLPLAQAILGELTPGLPKAEYIRSFFDAEKGVTTEKEAVAGAIDIAAEVISEHPVIRQKLRDFVYSTGYICSKATKEWLGKQSKFMMYYDHREKLAAVPSHRMLAVSRGTFEGVISWKIEVDNLTGISIITSGPWSCSKDYEEELELARQESWKKLIFPSLESEAFREKLKDSEKEAIGIFSKNLRNLLLFPPAGRKVIMGIDPGIRTGCKVSVIGRNGQPLEHAQIYPFAPKEDIKGSRETLLKLIKNNAVEIIAIGNGTASRETGELVAGLIKDNSLSLSWVFVSEAGASVYSASTVAIEEFPGLDVSQRGAISIARRLQDPLAELVKIEPKSIGVGQYQHDVDQNNLKDALDFTVESCVNFVGVNINTASPHLLAYVSGIGPATARRIKEYRDSSGAFGSKNQLLKIPRLSAKTFEQCAGFLRVTGAINPLDNSAIHPERYPLVERIAEDCGVGLKQLIGNDALISSVDMGKYVDDQTGMPTLMDIIKELKKPGIDPRKEFNVVEFEKSVSTIEDLKSGMILPGVITNITAFGAFVDVGVHHDGLIHISKMSAKFVADPHKLLTVGENVKVEVIAVDQSLKRIALKLLNKTP